MYGFVGWFSASGPGRLRVGGFPVVLQEGGCGDSPGIRFIPCHTISAHLQAGSGNPERRPHVLLEEPALLWMVPVQLMKLQPETLRVPDGDRHSAQMRLGGALELHSLLFESLYQEVKILD